MCCAWTLSARARTASSRRGRSRHGRGVLHRAVGRTARSVAAGRVVLPQFPAAGDGDVGRYTRLHVLLDAPALVLNSTPRLLVRRSNGTLLPAQRTFDIHRPDQWAQRRPRDYGATLRISSSPPGRDPHGRALALLAHGAQAVDTRRYAEVGVAAVARDAESDRQNVARTVTLHAQIKKPTVSPSRQYPPLLD